MNEQQALDLIKSACAQRDRDWEEALALAFNRYDADPARPPLEPSYVAIWAARIVYAIRENTTRQWVEALNDLTSDLETWDDAE